jgi:hypothetical protein
MELISQGTYKAAAVQVDGTYAQIGMSSTGNQQVLVQFEILEGPAAGRRVPWWGSFTDKSWNRTVEALRYCGFSGDDLSTLPAQELNHEVSIVVEHSEYNGKTNARVRWVNAAVSGIKLSKPMNLDELRNFGAMMKARVATVKAVEVAPPGVIKPAISSSATASTDDDPPF